MRRIPALAAAVVLVVPLTACRVDGSVECSPATQSCHVDVTRATVPATTRTETTAPTPPTTTTVTTTTPVPPVTTTVPGDPTPPTTTTTVTTTTPPPTTPIG